MPRMDRSGDFVETAVLENKVAPHGFTRQPAHNRIVDWWKKLIADDNRKQLRALVVHNN